VEKVVLNKEMSLEDRRLASLVLMKRLENGENLDWLAEVKFLQGCRRVRRTDQAVELEKVMWRNGRPPVRPVWKKETRETKESLIIILLVVGEVARSVEDVVVISLPTIGRTTREEVKEVRETRGAGPQPGDPRKWVQQRKFQRLPSIELQELNLTSWNTQAGPWLTWIMTSVCQDLLPT